MAPSAPEIPYARLVEMLGDPDVPKRDLLPYVRRESRPARPGETEAGTLGLGPVLEPSALVRFDDRASVDARARGDIGLGFLNWVYRGRRRREAERRIAAKDPRPVLLAEGDSWFQYPLFLEDTVDWLMADHTVLCLSAAGDELGAMVADGEMIEHLAALRADGVALRALLLSGGGNDIVGPELAELLTDFTPGATAEALIDRDSLDRKFAEIEAGYRDLADRAQAAFPDLPILIHGYDFALPRPDQGFNVPPLDGWLGDPMRGRGIPDGLVQAAIVRIMIDRINGVMERLDEGRGGLPGVHFVDNRGAVEPATQWHDELHPTDAGFARVAERFRAVLAGLGD